MRLKKSDWIAALREMKLGIVSFPFQFWERESNAARLKSGMDSMKTKLKINNCRQIILSTLIEAKKMPIFGRGSFLSFFSLILLLSSGRNLI